MTSTATAWDLIGWDDGLVQIAGGRAVYDAVFNFGGDQVRLDRLDQTNDGYLRVVSRYVDADTILVPAGDTDPDWFAAYAKGAR